MTKNAKGLINHQWNRLMQIRILRSDKSIKFYSFFKKIRFKLQMEPEHLIDTSLIRADGISTPPLQCLFP